MKRAQWMIKQGIVNQFVIAFFLLIGPLTVTHAACCASHGGVASCNKSTGYQMCKDGTASPTCTCTKSKKATSTTLPAKNTPSTNSSKPTKSTLPAKNTPNKPSKSWWGTSTTTPSSNTKNKTTGSTSAKGCCSSHGGVAQCDKSSGHQMCKDGTQSPTCSCQ